MIRDPSDGTVRGKDGLTCKRCGEAFFPDHSQEREPTTGLCWLCFHVADKTKIGPDTGLRQPTQTKAQLRLEESRKWLKDYHAKKEREHAERGSDEERSTDGDSGHDQGEAESGIPDLDGADHGTHREG
jgi:hypothetical protein